MDIAALERLSTEARVHILESVHVAGAGHIGGPLSAVDILVHLYFNELRIDPENPRWPDRDRFILSKGHSSIGLYTVMAMRGYFPVAQLSTFDSIDSLLQGHPCMKTLPGIDMSSGSLGQGLSPGLGMALAARKLGNDFHTWVMLGDGEIQEGQIWEACFTAARYQADNLTAILDYNGLPQFGWPDPSGYTREVPFDHPAEKFRAFGWHTVECDGHDHASIATAIAEARETRGRPTCIIAHTVKGRGVSFMEGDYLWHAKAPSKEELAAAIAELTGDSDVEKAA